MSAAQTLADSRGALHGRARQDDGELLAPVARHEVHPLSRLRLDPHRHVAQHGVAGAMPEPVVVGLEVVDVDHQQRQRQLVALRAGDLLREAVVEVAVVVQVGEAVGDGEVFEDGEDVGVVDGDRSQHGELREEQPLGLGESPAVARLDDAQDPDQLSAELEGPVEVGLLAPAVHLGGLGGRQVGSSRWTSTIRRSLTTGT